ncbi:hypothetical protein [Sorangium sp. So ce233]|uniref:hypothetical protein n=1 Tax=Sorangium sp. So ce233 TaxID=3133290 RepID=UPI003F6273A1
MAKACVDGGDETRVLLWASETDLRSIDRLSTDGARSLAHHLAVVSTERALVERHALMLLQEHSHVGGLDELNEANAWVRAVEAGETPRHRADEFRGMATALGEDAWTGTYGEAKGAFARRQTLATLALASAVITARTDNVASDADVITGMLEATQAWTRAALGAWAGWMEDVT